MIHSSRRSTPAASSMQDRLHQVTQSSPAPVNHRNSSLPSGQQAPSALQLAALLRRDGTPVLVISVGGDVGIITIGRGDEVDVSLSEPVVSQVHAHLHWDAERGGHMLTDRGSTNGTYINRRRILGPVMLLNGMCIHVGSVALWYRRPFHAVP